MTRITIRASALAAAVAPATERCAGGGDWVECALPARVLVGLGDGAGHMAFSAWEKTIPVAVRGGDGNDLLEGYTILGEDQGSYSTAAPASTRSPRTTSSRRSRPTR